MKWGWRWTALLLMALAGGWPVFACARPVPAAQTCHAFAAADEGYAVVARDPRRWLCDDDGWSIKADVMFMRFRLADNAPLPHSFVTLASRYSSITLWAVDEGGAVRSLRYGPDVSAHMAAGPLMAMRLPSVSPATRMIVVRILGPWTKAIGSDARLDSNPEGSGWPIGQVVAMAAICGLLVVPLLLNGAFYGVLPERFVLWHLVLTGTMLLQVLIGTGFIHLLVDLTEGVEAPLSNLCYATMASSALMFAATFIESGKLAPRIRTALYRTAPIVFVLGSISALPVAWMRPWATLLVHVDMMPAMLLIAIAAFDGCRNGSRAAWYQLAGWAPAILAGVWRILRYLLPFTQPADSTVTYQLGMAVQVLVTTIGIISRFVDLRHERDSATARAIELEGVAGRDPLTGLRNRHSIERHFEDLFRKGFRTMAVLDLDNFKLVNDHHGHAVGDLVLKAAASALTDDADTRAIRMGGEEFLLLCRGPASAERAERYRRAISARIAAGVPGLDRVVTASMGLVEHDPAGTLQIEFVALYSHCDRLLYEAKRLGRNRTMRERVTGFAAEAAATA